MDPLTGLVLVVLLGGTSLVGATVIKDKYPKYKKKQEEKMAEEQEEIRFKNEMNKIRAGISEYEKINMYDVKTGKSYSVDGKREKCSENNFKNNVIFKGKIELINTKGKIESEDIYLYQPIVYTKNNVCLGPKLNNGRLGEDYNYISKFIDEDGKTCYLSGYIPKREVASGIEMDYVYKSSHIANQKYARFLRVIIPRDENGNYIPVDFSKESEVKEFRKYLDYHNNDGIDNLTYFYTYIDKAKDTSHLYDELHKPQYATAATLENFAKEQMDREQRLQEEANLENAINTEMEKFKVVDSRLYKERPFIYGPRGPMGRPPMGGPMMPPPPNRFR